MLAFYNRLYIFLTFKINLVFLVIFTLYNLTTLLGYNVVFADQKSYGDLPLACPNPNSTGFSNTQPGFTLFPNSTLPETKNGLVLGVEVTYPSNVWLKEIEERKQYWLKMFENNKPDPVEVYILENKNLRLNIQPSFFSYAPLTESVNGLFYSHIMGKFDIANEEVKHLLCYLSILEKRYVYLGDTAAAGCRSLEDLYHDLKRFFPDPYDQKNRNYYFDINLRQSFPKHSFSVANDALLTLVNFSEYNPLLIHAFVMKNHLISLHSFWLKDGFLCPEASQYDCYCVLLKNFKQNFNL